MERTFDEIGEFFIANKNLPDADKTRAFMKADGRRGFFKIEALARILSEQSPKFFEKQRLYFKEIENATGALDLKTDLRKTAEELKEPKLIEYFTKQEQQAQVNLMEALKASGLWTQPEATIAKWRAEFAQKGKWENGKKEKKALVKVISDYARELHELVSKDTFDDPDIEKGLHKLRRSLRWINSQVGALDGIVQMQDEVKLRNRVNVLITNAVQSNPAMMQNKYLLLSSPLVAEPILVPRKSSAMIAEYVGRIGESKDSAEMQIYFGEALKALGATPAEVARVTKELQDLLKTATIDHQALSRQIMQELAASKLLKRFADDIEDMNEG